MRHAFGRPCRRVFLLAQFLLGASAWASPSRALAPLYDSAVVPLQTGTVVISERSTRTFWETLRSMPSGELHALVWFARHPSPQERSNLRSSGITLLSPVFRGVYWARVRAAADTARSPVKPLLFAAVAPVNRMAPRIWAEKLETYVTPRAGSALSNYVLNADGTLNLIVLFHEGIHRALAQDLLQRETRVFQSLSDIYWKIVVSPAGARRIAGFDQVHWIDAALPPLRPDNAFVRATIKADPVQQFNTAAGTLGGLGGKGVTVGVFDFGIDDSHDDFGTRIVPGDVGLDWHATHVAGVIAGDGKLSNGSDSWARVNSGTAYQWRGVAPQARLIDANANSAFEATKMSSHIRGLGMRVSNHSYSYSFDGEYLHDGFADRLIRGDIVEAGVLIPGRLHVYSTGNHGDVPRLGGEQIGYFSLTKQTKNGLMVGNYDARNNMIHATTSLGPAHDGRVKPDVVAPGTDVISTGYCSRGVSGQNPNSVCDGGSATSRHDFYHPMIGSSDAAAAVTGLQALVLQQFDVLNPGRVPRLFPPWPSTLRAIAIHTAQDIVGTGSPWYSNPDGPVQAFAGPDFVTGYGMVDAQAAVAVMANKRYVQDVVREECQVRTWWIRVPAASPELRVTLAWDDWASDPDLPPTLPKLVNDLDLELVPPASIVRHYPWLLDQRVIDAAGNPVSDASQACGPAVLVERKVIPSTAPYFGTGIGDPNNVNDGITSATLQPAGRGKDHLNNTEQVAVASPAAGWWQVRITGFTVPFGPQRYSLVATSRPVLRVPGVGLCPGSPFCGLIFPNRVCDRFPAICDLKPLSVQPGAIPVKFVNSHDRIVIPLDRICLFLLDCELCGSGICPELDLRLESMPAAFSLEIFNMEGRRVFSDRSNRRTKRVRLSAEPGHEYVLVIGPGRGVRMGRGYSIPITTASPLPL